jgi:hypothetical protein
MTYRLTKRKGCAGNHAFQAQELESLDECLRLALGDEFDFIIQDQRGVVDYRIADVRKSD